MRKISVIVPVYNASKYLREAIDSLLNQTFTDFELIVIDDKSSDDSVEILRSYDDSRIKIYLNEENIGAGATRNRGIDIAEGEYIAFADSDDVMYPVRFEQQIAFLDSHPDIGICGAACWVTNEKLEKLHVWKCPKTHDQSVVELLYGCPINQSVVMLRREALVVSGVKYVKGNYAEDYDFWNRALKKMKCYNLPTELMLYRSSPNQLSTNSYDKQRNDAIIVIDTILNEIGVKTDDAYQTATIQYELFRRRGVKFPKESVLNYLDVCLAIWNLNKKSKIYNNKELKRKLLLAHKRAEYLIHSKLVAKYNTFFLFARKLK